MPQPRPEISSRLRAGSRSRLLVALLVLVAVFAQSGISLGKPASKTTLKSKLGKVEKQKAYVRAQIHKKEGQKRVVLGQLTVTERALEKAQSSLSVNKIKLLGAKADLAQTVRRLARTKRQLERRRTLLSRRVVDIYEGDDLNYADVVLGASDMWTFLTRAYYLQRILDSDTSLISQIREDKAAIERDKAHETQVVRSIQGTQVRLEAERNQIASLADQRTQQLNAIEHDKALYEKMLDDLEAQSNAIEAQLQAYQHTAVGRARSLRPFRGGLMMPVSGRITSRFGYRVHPITGVYKLHTGVDISCSTGTPIHAAADGTVYQACYNRAYGNMVIINHDGGISTLYGHNSRLMVHAGQEVHKGDVVALAGSTGYATGPHCHFEKRVNGTPVNPM